MPNLKVSIVTPSFNQAKFLPATLRSVREQTYPGIEHIVVDGGSTDGSAGILRAAPGIRWISERDSGQVDAINKGFAMAKGDVLAWLNSDDTMRPDAVQIAVDALESTGADLVYGDVRIIDQDGTHERMFYGMPFDYHALLYGIDYIGQQSVFFRRTLLDKAGPLRTEFDNAFDYELWLRMARHGRLVYVPQLRGQIRRHAEAKSIAAAQRTWSETDTIRREYWRTGGLPSFLEWQPFAGMVNWYYRFKRIRRIREASRTSASTHLIRSGAIGQRQEPSPQPSPLHDKGEGDFLSPSGERIEVRGRSLDEPGRDISQQPRLLVFGYLPPPIYGPAITYQALLRSSFPERFDVSFVNLNVVRDYRELEVFHWRKLGALARQLGLELWHLAGQRFDFVFYPVSLNRNAFLKDAMFLAIARAFRVPIVLYGHGNHLPEFRDKSPRWLQGMIDRAVRGAVAATVPGKNLRFNFLKHLREDQVFAVTNGIEVPTPLPTAPKEPGRFTVLYLGNLVREKGVFVILDAIPLVRARCPEAYFVFAGAWWSEKDGAEAGRLVRDRDLSSCTEFTGMVTGDRKWAIVSQGDVLVFPTYYHPETLGQVLLEAMGAGLPVITTRRAAIPEIVEDGVNGLFVAEQDPADLAEKILTLAGDPALRARMGEANRRKYAASYTVESYGQRMTAVFEELLARRKRDNR
ncbi:MAG TPA: glycosyltransferase [Verrucomicrobiae bacterium]|nr:glycosyltransferase [Verrucomicrobiae bacterium]